MKDRIQRNAGRLPHQVGAKDLIPPRKSGRLSPSLTRKNNALLEIKGLGGGQLAREIWGNLTSYSRRALAETNFSRLKRLYGGRFFSKKIETQKIESHIKCFKQHDQITMRGQEVCEK